jgi:hypothetical protein
VWDKKKEVVSPQARLEGLKNVVQVAANALKSDQSIRLSESSGRANASGASRLPWCKLCEMAFAGRLLALALP